MLRILIATHGPLASGLMASATMIYGQLDGVSKVSLTEDGVVAFQSDFEHALATSSQGVDGILVLCDIQGGTPYNTACRHAFATGGSVPVAVLAGVNLPMLLEAMGYLDTSDVMSAASQLIESAKSTIALAQPVSVAKASNDEEF